MNQFQYENFINEINISIGSILKNYSYIFMKNNNLKGLLLCNELLYGHNNENGDIVDCSAAFK